MKYDNSFIVFLNSSQKNTGGDSLENCGPKFLLIWNDAN
jgi:hypothetical protein